MDFTEQMVLDHVIRGLADEAIQAKVLAMPEVDVTLPKVIKFIESEELAKWSLSDTKAIGPVSGVSSYKKLIKMNKNEMKKRCRRCGDNVWPHPEENPCPALNETCEFCTLKGHRVKACKKKRKSDKEKQGEDDGSKVESITTTGRGYLFQVKNVASRQKNMLKPLRYDRSLRKFVHKSGIGMQKTGVEIRIDRDNYALINKDIMNNKFPHIDLLSKRTATSSAVADTGACVCCSGPNMLKELGIAKTVLFDTNMELSAANKKRMTVMGCIPVLLSARTIDKQMSEPIHVMLYIVDELQEVFLSREAMEELRIIPETYWKLNSSILYEEEFIENFSVVLSCFFEVGVS